MLRELLGNLRYVYDQGKPIGRDLCAFLEALMDELEAQRPPRVDARIAELTTERDSWERQCRNAECGLAEAKAQIGTVQRSRDYWHKRCRESEHQEAANARRNNADAALGRLVWGMENDCYLVKRENLYHTARRDWGGYWLYVGNRESTSDPAKALRAIQREKPCG